MICPLRRILPYRAKPDYVPTGAIAINPIRFQKSLSRSDFIVRNGREEQCAEAFAHQTSLIVGSCWAWSRQHSSVHRGAGGEGNARAIRSGRELLLRCSEAVGCHRAGAWLQRHFGWPAGSRPSRSDRPEGQGRQRDQTLLQAQGAARQPPIKTALGGTALRLQLPQVSLPISGRITIPLQSMIRSGGDMPRLACSHQARICLFRKDVD